MVTALSSSKQSSANRILSLSDVVHLLKSCIGPKNGNFSQSFTVGDEQALALIRFCVWDGAACSVSSDLLRSFLCGLPTYRVLQKRLQVIMDIQLHVLCIVLHVSFYFTLLRQYQTQYNISG